MKVKDLIDGMVDSVFVKVPVDSERYELTDRLNMLVLARLGQGAYKDSSNQHVNLVLEEIVTTWMDAADVYCEYQSLFREGVTVIGDKAKIADCVAAVVCDNLLLLHTYACTLNEYDDAVALLLLRTLVTRLNIEDSDRRRQAQLDLQ